MSKMKLFKIPTLFLDRRQTKYLAVYLFDVSKGLLLYTVTLLSGVTGQLLVVLCMMTASILTLVYATLFIRDMKKGKNDLARIICNRIRLFCSRSDHCHNPNDDIY